MDEKALATLLSEVASTPAMAAIGDLMAGAKKDGLRIDIIERLSPVLCEYLIVHQANDKTEESAIFLAKLIKAVQEFPSDFEKLLTHMK